MHDYSELNKINSTSNLNDKDPKLGVVDNKKERAIKSELRNKRNSQISLKNSIDI